MKTINELQELWRVLFPKSTCPSDAQFAIWLLRFDEHTVRDGIARTAIKYEKLRGDMDDEFLLKYASAAMGRIKQEAAWQNITTKAVCRMP
jgi:hypothetical protein